MEGMLGRLLTTADGVVHHRDEVKTHNLPGNLQLLESSEHARHHSAGRGLLPLTEQEVRTALQGRTTQEAADLLGVSHQTLRNRWPHLLTMRVSPGGPYPTTLVDAVRFLAADPTVGTRAACERLGVAQVTLRRVRERHGIPWVSAPTGRPSRRV